MTEVGKTLPAETAEEIANQVGNDMAKLLREEDGLSAELANLVGVAIAEMLRGDPPRAVLEILRTAPEIPTIVRKMLIDDYESRLEPARRKPARTAAQELALRRRAQREVARHSERLSKAEAIEAAASELNMSRKALERYIYPADEREWLTTRLEKHPPFN